MLPPVQDVRIHIVPYVQMQIIMSLLASIVFFVVLLMGLILEVANNAHTVHLFLSLPIAKFLLPN